MVLVVPTLCLALSSPSYGADLHRGSQWRGISDTTLTKLMHLLYKARGGDAPTHECAAPLLAAGLMDAAAAPMPACEFSGTEVRLPSLAQQRMPPPLPALVAKNLCR